MLYSLVKHACQPAHPASYPLLLPEGERDVAADSGLLRASSIHFRGCGSGRPACRAVAAEWGSRWPTSHQVTPAESPHRSTM